MARPRTPTAALELKGSYKINPGRREDRAFEPKLTEAVGGPPDILSAAEVVLWKEFARAGSTWLTVADRRMLQTACILSAEMDAGAADMATARIGLLLKALAELGFGPAARSRVKATPVVETEVNPFEAFN